MDQLMRKKRGSKVIPFKQDGEFFYRRARKYMSDNNFFEALSYYTKAVEMEPDNPEYLLDLAEAFTETDNFEESNQILLGLIQQGEEVSECFFGLGCNFMGMQEYAKAQESFLKYLQLDPEGIYAEDANEILDMLEEGEYEEDFSEAPHFIKAATKGKQYLDRHDVRRAIRSLEKALQEDPKPTFVRNNLALAYFLNGEKERAISLSEKVLADDANNLHALCNLSLFHQSEGQLKSAQRYMDVAEKLKPDTPEDLYKLSATLYELGRHEQAYKRLKSLLRYKPYDKPMLHALAACCFNNGRYGEASRWWGKIEKLDQNNTIAPYYSRLSADRLEKGLEPPAEEDWISYQFQVPHNEVVRRIRMVNDWLRKKDDLGEQWLQNEEFRKLVLWAISLEDMMVKRAMLHLIGSFRDGRAQRVLRQFLLRRNEPDGLKRDVFALLKQMGAKEPYMAYLDGEIVEVKVSVLKHEEGKVPADYKKALEAAVRSMRGRYDAEFADDLMQLWEKAVPGLSETSRVFRHEAWAAVLEYVYCQKNNLRITKTFLCKHYHISLPTFNRTLAKLMAAITLSEEIEGSIKPTDEENTIVETQITEE